MPYLALPPMLGVFATLCLFVGGDITNAADPVVVVTEGAIPGIRQPQVAVGNTGTIVVTFGAGETIYCCKSTDRGRTYTSPTKVGHVPKLALGMRRGPRIVAIDDHVVITAISHETGNVLAWSSLDGGESWRDAVDVNDESRSAREGLHDLAIGRDGLLFCTWLDLRNGQTQVYGARSKDLGKTWEKNAHVYTSPSGTVCECCHPSVVIDQSNAVHVMWRNLIDGNRDMYVSTSEDDGQTFGSAEKLGLDSWQLNACPMDGGDIAANSNGDLLTVWRHDRSVYSAGVGLKREKYLGRGEQPSIVAASDGDFISWVDRRGGELLLLRPGSTNPVTIATSASDPVLAASVTGGGPVVLVWESKAGDVSSIRSEIVNE
ncbi:glycosyl hydrolase [Rhodopirellula sp. SM50]|nr:sialidase family protein [Rhodopirellula sp. SM50]PAY16879.1 glycosyl hydrolase [Rhodopirellula sp. SM50]